MERDLVLAIDNGTLVAKSRVPLENYRTPKPGWHEHDVDAAGLGAATGAAVGIGLHGDFGCAVRAMTRVARRFEPDPGTRNTYDVLDDRVYKNCTRGLRGSTMRLRQITGYAAPKDASE